MQASIDNRLKSEDSWNMFLSKVKAKGQMLGKRLEECCRGNKGVEESIRNRRSGNSSMRVKVARYRRLEESTADYLPEISKIKVVTLPTDQSKFSTNVDGRETSMVGFCFIQSNGHQMTSQRKCSNDLPSYKGPLERSVNRNQESMTKAKVKRC